MLYIVFDPSTLILNQLYINPNLFGSNRHSWWSKSSFLPITSPFLRVNAASGHPTRPPPQPARFPRGAFGAGLLQAEHYAALLHRREDRGDDGGNVPHTEENGGGDRR